MNSNEIVIGVARSTNEVQQLLKKLNEFFVGSHYHAETSTEEVESMSGHKSNLVKIKLVNDTQKYYFTFGSAEHYPYQNGYLIVYADSWYEAVEKYRDKYPDKTEDNVNCSFIYSQDEWDETIHSTPCYEIIRQKGVKNYD